MAANRVQVERPTQVVEALVNEFSRLSASRHDLTDGDVQERIGRYVMVINQQQAVCKMPEVEVEPFKKGGCCGVTMSRLCSNWSFFRTIMCCGVRNVYYVQGESHGTLTLSPKKTRQLSDLKKQETNATFFLDLYNTYDGYLAPAWKQCIAYLKEHSFPTSDIEYWENWDPGSTEPLAPQRARFFRELIDDACSCMYELRKDAMKHLLLTSRPTSPTTFHTNSETLSPNSSGGRSVMSPVARKGSFQPVTLKNSASSMVNGQRSSSLLPVMQENQMVVLQQSNSLTSHIQEEHSDTESYSTPPEKSPHLNNKSNEISTQPILIGESNTDIGRPVSEEIYVDAEDSPQVLSGMNRQESDEVFSTPNESPERISPLHMIQEGHIEEHELEPVSRQASMIEKIVRINQLDIRFSREKIIEDLLEMTFCTLCEAQQIAQDVENKLTFPCTLESIWELLKQEVRDRRIEVKATADSPKLKQVIEIMKDDFLLHALPDDLLLSDLIAEKQVNKQRGSIFRKQQVGREVVRTGNSPASLSITPGTPGIKGGIIQGSPIKHHLNA